MGFVFCCSAGNIKFSECATPPKIPSHPFCFFNNCEHCIVIGSYGSKEACIPSTFGSAGCCICDQLETGTTDFQQGVTTWALGENVAISKIYSQKDNQIVGVVAGAVTLIAPKVITLLERLRK